MNWRRLIGLLFLILIAFTAGCAAHVEHESSSAKANIQEIVATVNGEPIRYGELEILMLRQRSDVIQYFYDKYNAEDSTQYWTTAFGKERPIDRLKSAALAEAKKIKIQQIIARNEGVVQRIDYSDFRNDWIQENDRRKRAAAQKQMIYGPLQYDENTYYEYLFSNMVLQVKEKQRKHANISVKEGERLYGELLERKLIAASEVIQRDVYDRILNP
ncbi:hypothetical protein Back11_36520 [Paenibacillus baekrokdamisoli]|uniref:Uncharacterized protein n=2 Tax=Paenibacillus baekrokdamisoli TaxID=1712516 RepID=A0A3G9ITV7_9BACL|nr:hypothetical protein [Paenibacillus baekrokdamisoli]BBH22307.1 hypothetical protein Back11_36520 [Paenibacillus baekrokdamisoli]